MFLFFIFTILRFSLVETVIKTWLITIGPSPFKSKEERSLHRRERQKNTTTSSAAASATSLICNCKLVWFIFQLLTDLIFKGFLNSHWFCSILFLFLHQMESFVDKLVVSGYFSVDRIQYNTILCVYYLLIIKFIHVFHCLFYSIREM